MSATHLKYGDGEFEVTDNFDINAYDRAFYKIELS